MQSTAISSLAMEGGAITYWRRQTDQERAVLAFKLRQARLEAGLGQREVGRDLGIPQSIISELENGQRRLDMAELMCLASLYSKPPSWFLSKQTDEVQKQPPVMLGSDLVRLAEAPNAKRTINRTTSLREEDQKALSTIAALSDYPEAKIMWLGDVHFLQSTVLIPLVFRFRPLEDDLLDAIRRQASQTGMNVPGISVDAIIGGITEVIIDYCQALPDWLEFGGKMVLQVKTNAGTTSLTGNFEAVMSRDRIIRITWLTE